MKKDGTINPKWLPIYNVLMMRTLPRGNSWYTRAMLFYFYKKDLEAKNKNRVLSTRWLIYLITSHEGDTNYPIVSKDKGPLDMSMFQMD